MSTEITDETIDRPINIEISYQGQNVEMRIAHWVGTQQRRVKVDTLIQKVIFDHIHGPNQISGQDTVTRVEELLQLGAPQFAYTPFSVRAVADIIIYEYNKLEMNFVGQHWANVTGRPMVPQDDPSPDAHTGRVILVKRHEQDTKKCITDQGLALPPHSPNKYCSIGRSTELLRPFPPPRPNLNPLPPPPPYEFVPYLASGSGNPSNQGAGSSGQRRE